MLVQIKAVGIELSESMDNYTHEKVPKLSRYLTPNQDEAAVAEVMLIFSENDTRGTKDKCHITITGLGKGQVVHAEAEEADMHVAIDAAVHKAEEQLRREKDKRRDHMDKEKRQAKEMPVEELLDLAPPDPTEADEE